MTTASKITLVRVVLIPVYIVIYLRAKTAADYYIAAGILAVSCLTDLIDGKIARHFNMISNTGKILDPLADKATQFTLIVCLTIKHPVLLILIALFVVKEGFQLVAGFMILRRGKILSGALLSGKICTTVLFISLILMVMIPQMNEFMINILTAINCVFMLISFVGYARIYYTQSPMIQEIDPKATEE